MRAYQLTPSVYITHHFLNKVRPDGGYSLVLITCCDCELAGDVGLLTRSSLPSSVSPDTIMVSWDPGVKWREIDQTIKLYL